jgi:hypothetical protein
MSRRQVWWVIVLALWLPIGLTIGVMVDSVPSGANYTGYDTEIGDLIMGIGSGIPLLWGVPILILATWLDEPIWRALQSPETRERIDTEKMGEQIQEAVGVDTALVCRSCKAISRTRGEPAMGNAANYSCYLCGHYTLVPLHRPETVADAHERAGLTN